VGTRDTTRGQLGAAPGVGRSFEPTEPTEPGWPADLGAEGDERPEPRRRDRRHGLVPAPGGPLGRARVLTVLLITEPGMRYRFEGKA
jgi:hypothetical protein